jgi:hypothetical protein
VKKAKSFHRDAALAWENIMPIKLQRRVLDAWTLRRSVQNPRDVFWRKSQANLSLNAGRFSFPRRQGRGYAEKSDGRKKGVMGSNISQVKQK